MYYMRNPGSAARCILANNSSYQYDAYLSFSPTDEEWVEEHLLPSLNAAGVRVCVPRSMPLGYPKIENIGTAVAQSRKIILILTPSWVADDWSQYATLLARTSDPNAMLARTIPVLVRPCTVPSAIKNLEIETADLTDPARRDHEFARIIATVRPPRPPVQVPSIVKRIFISYKRSAKPDSTLAKLIFDQLTEAGHVVFIDQKIKIGQVWGKRIEQEIEVSDYIVVLLSELAVQSEMMIKEIEHAYWQHHHNGKPKLLPVRVNYTGVLPYPLNNYLNHIQYAEWLSHTPDNTVLLMSQLLAAIGCDNELPESSEAWSSDGDSNRGILPSPAYPISDSQTEIADIDAFAFDDTSLVKISENTVVQPTKVIGEEIKKIWLLTKNRPFTTQIAVNIEHISTLNFIEELRIGAKIIVVGNAPYNRKISEIRGIRNLLLRKITIAYQTNDIFPILTIPGYSSTLGKDIETQFRNRWRQTSDLESDIEFHSKKRVGKIVTRIREFIPSGEFLKIAIPQNSKVEIVSTNIFEIVNGVQVPLLEIAKVTILKKED
jgi:hypothetical protein